MAKPPKTVFVIAGNLLQSNIRTIGWWRENWDWFVNEVIPKLNSTSDEAKLTIKRKSSPKIQEGSPISILFLVREKSVSSEILTAMVEAVNLTIKRKSSWTHFEQMPLTELGFIKIAGGDKNRDVSGEVKSPTLGELFQKYGAVLALNIADEPTNLPGAEWIKVWPPNSLPRYMKFLDLWPSDGSGNREKKKGKDTGGMDAPNFSQNLIVITFNQTAETIGEFKELFCGLFHNDCEGPIGKPEPLPFHVNVKRYSRLMWNKPIGDAETLRSVILREEVIKQNFGASPVEPDQFIACMERDASGKCTWWRVCGTHEKYTCYDVIYCDGKWQAVWW